MNYRVFYPSESPEEFQNGNGYVVELVQAIEDAVKDGADVISNSWGSSYQNTLAWPDPMVQAAEAAVDAGVVGVWAQATRARTRGPAIRPSSSEKVIASARSRRTRRSSRRRHVTAPRRCRRTSRTSPFGGAGFGPQMTTHVGPAPYVPGRS